MSELERSFKGIWIPKEIWLAADLSLQEKVFLVEIDSLDNGEGCYASNEYFSKFFGLSKNRCSEVIKSLEKKKLISVSYQYQAGKKAIEKRFIKVVGFPTRVFDFSTEVFGKSTGGIRFSDRGYSENCEENNIDMNNIREKIKEIEYTPPKAPLFPEYGKALNEAIANWLSYKKERREAYKPTGLKSLYTQIDKQAKIYGEKAVADLITLSMSNGWRGIIWDKLKEKDKGSGNPFLDMLEEERCRETKPYPF